MKRKKQPLERMEVTDAPAKAKVAMVLEVLSGEKTITQACQETGLKPLQYYKVEEKMVRAMLETAQMPVRRGPSRAAEAMQLSEETAALRQEHQRMRSLLRVSRKLMGLGQAKTRKYTRRKVVETPLPSPGTPVEAPRRPGRPPLQAATAIPKEV